jgi:hypothetical protein
MEWKILQFLFILQPEKDVYMNAVFSIEQWSVHPNA